ncbi:MAG: hypothetical protein LBQ37_02595 [Elusimicrobiota bacterium]|jgi:hypothetical protein|nr:hypothetical protein [Elusimicrobiota bacterium]
MRIQKITRKDKSFITVVYGEERNKVTVSSTEPCHVSFRNALFDLVMPFVMASRLAVIPDIQDEYEIKEVGFAYKDEFATEPDYITAVGENNVGTQIKVHIENADDVKKVIENLIMEARLFVNGRRAQTEFPFNSIVVLPEEKLNEVDDLKKGLKNAN